MPLEGVTLDSSTVDCLAETVSGLVARVYRCVVVAALRREPPLYATEGYRLLYQKWLPDRRSCGIALIREVVRQCPQPLDDVGLLTNRMGQSLLFMLDIALEGVIAPELRRQIDASISETAPPCVDRFELSPLLARHFDNLRAFYLDAYLVNHLPKVAEKLDRAQFVRARSSIHRTRLALLRQEATVIELALALLDPVAATLTVETAAAHAISRHVEHPVDLEFHLRFGEYP